MKNRGVIYCATGNVLYLEATLISAIVLRQIEPNIPITIISDHPLLKLFPLEKYEISARFINLSEINDSGSFSSRDIKTSLSKFSPYQETLFLDADILPLKPISDLWDYLDYGDMCMVVDLVPTLGLCAHISEEEKNYTLQYLPESTTQFNSGVILWRNTTQTQSLFELWNREWLKFKKQDQLALVRAINKAEFSVQSLPCIYNISPIDSISRIENKSVKTLTEIHEMCQFKALSMIKQSMLKQKNDICLLHCLGGPIALGRFPEIAQKFYPNIVEQVVATGIFRKELPVN